MHLLCLTGLSQNFAW